MEVDDVDEIQPMASQAPRKSMPWVEKYRPEKVDDISHQEEIVRALKSSISSGNLPHLLFHGPPGTGKTTTILAVARELYGPELYRSRVLELNASDDRGISAIREKVKVFAQGAVGGRKSSGYPCPRYKIIILDEADTMTPDAQSALRRVMETYSKVTRFCLVCNYVTRIIEPLASRCAKFRFKSLPFDCMKSRLEHIAENENIKYIPGSIESILEVSNGDMRKAVTFLQSSHQLCSAQSQISRDMVFEISGQVPPTVVERFWRSTIEGRIDNMIAVAKDILLDGYSVASILIQLQQLILIGFLGGDKMISDVEKCFVCEKIAEVEKCLLDGASESLQLQELGSFMIRSFSKV